jgi:hypothetical protein
MSAVGPDSAIGDHALSLAEQIRHDAGIAHRHVIGGVGHGEGCGAAIGGTLQRALDHQPAEAEALPFRHLAGMQLARAMEE